MRSTLPGAAAPRRAARAAGCLCAELHTAGMPALGRPHYPARLRASDFGTARPARLRPPRSRPPAPRRLSRPAAGVGHYGGQRSGLGLAPQGMKPASGQAHGSPARVAYAPGQHGTPGPPAAQTAQGNMTPQGAMQLDETVARNKNLRDSMIVENWIRKSQQIMQKFKLDPLPDFPAMDGTHSDTGTDFSAALTMEAHDQVAHLLCVAPVQ